MFLTELLSGVQIGSDGETSRDLRSPTAGPSGTYRNPQRQDSVIPPSTQQGAEDLEVDHPPHHHHGAFNANGDMWRSAWMSSLNVDVTKIETWQEKQHRMELFKLLLSYLNSINQFSPESYEPEAEERMNHLLNHLWINDAEALRSSAGDRFPALQAAWERWMSMRHLLAEFQRTTGYFGKPGDDWKEHLRRMDRVAHAKASIAFVDLKSFASGPGSALDGETTFNDDLVAVFDLLTQVEGCNGVEEFDALRPYNEGLMEWFS